MTQPATRVRYTVLAFLCALSMITYIDRAFWGNAREDIRISLGMETVADLSLAMVAFQIAYALFEVPTGYLGDRYGPRKTLIRIVLWWSFFFSLTALAGLPIFGYVLVGFTVLVIVRFCFGMGEAGAYPNITRGLYNWFPVSQRGFAQGAVWMSARFMGGLTPLIWLCLVDPQLLGLHWRTGFWLFGGIGVAWCLAFALWFRNKPEEHPATNQAERKLIASGRGPEAVHSGVPWGKIFRSRNMWYVCGMYVCINYGWYFFMYFLPDFLKREFGRASHDLGDRAVMALLAGGPLLLGVFGCLLGGILTDRHVRRTGDRKWGRSLYGALGFGLAAGSYAIAIMGVRAGNMWVFAAGVGMAGFFNDIAMGPSWAVCQDIGRRYSAIVSGFMNMVGNLGGALTLFITDLIIKTQVDAFKATADERGLTIDQAREAGLLAGYQINLVLYAIAYAIGVIFWLKIDATKPIVADETQAESATAEPPL
jgi:MFS family permease